MPFDENPSGRVLAFEDNPDLSDFDVADDEGSRAPLSEDAQIIERLTLSDDQSRLDYHMTIIDPTYLTEPATLDRYWLALGLEVEHYECVVE